MNAPTINQAEISKRLNISRATVNRALKGHPSVKEETREMIIQFAREMGYVPSAAALTMRRQGRTEQIGLMLPHLESHRGNTKMLDVIGGINHQLEDLGYLLSLVRVDDIRHVNTSKAFRERVLDGMIVTQINDEETLDACSKIVPHIIWMENTRSDPTCCLRRDERGAVQDVIRYVVERGYTKLFWYGNRPNYPDAHFSVIDRFGGFHSATRECGVEHTVLDCYELRTRQEDTWRELALDQDCCIVCYDQRYAQRANQLIAETVGLVAGRDYGLISCDSSDNCTDQYPELTRLYLDMFQYGKSAASMMLDLLEDPQSPPASRFVRPDFVVGQTIR